MLRFYSGRSRSCNKDLKLFKDLIDTGLEIEIIVPDERWRDRVREFGIPERLITICRPRIDLYDLARICVDELTTEIEASEALNLADRKEEKL